MRLRTQLLLGVGVLVAVLAAMAVFSMVMRARVVDLRAQHAIAASLQDGANDLSYLSGNYLLYEEPTHKARWDAIFNSFTADLDSLEASGSTDLAILGTIRADTGRLEEVFADVVSAAGGAAGGSIGGGQAFLQVSWSRLEVQHRQLVFGATRIEGLLERRLERANRINTAVAFGMMGLFGLLLLGAYVLMYRRTIAGIALLRAGAESVGRGDLDYLIPAGRQDEIGDLSRAFNTMTIDLKSVTASKTELEKEVEQRKRAEKETARLLAEQNSLFERLQTTLLNIPQELPSVRYSHLYRSATRMAQVGGDFYDVFAADSGQVGLLIGDVAGHGIEAARIAMLVKDTVRAFAYQSSRPSHVLRETNRLMLGTPIPGFVTVFLAFLEPETGTLTFSSAGHPPPFLGPKGGFLMPESIGLPLGIRADAGYSDTEVLIDAGAVLLLYTDGMTEARRRGQFFGEDGLRDSLSKVPDLDVCELPGFLLEEALRFTRGHLDDDVALLAVEYVGL